MRFEFNLLLWAPFPIYFLNVAFLNCLGSLFYFCHLFCYQLVTVKKGSRNPSLIKLTIGYQQPLTHLDYCSSFLTNPDSVISLQEFQHCRQNGVLETQKEQSASLPKLSSGSLSPRVSQGLHNGLQGPSQSHPSLPFRRHFTACLLSLSPVAWVSFFFLEYSKYMPAPEFLQFCSLLCLKCPGPREPHDLFP